jgi:ribosomal protein S18 acetylase RimI-like enzyme
VQFSLEHLYRLIGGASDGARLFERDGVLAAVVPVAPERSVLNAVTYAHPGALRNAYDELAAAYEQIGAQWTVWVHHGDDESAGLLRECGHVLDAEPEAMARALDDPPARPQLEDWTSEGSMTDVAVINDLAYGYGTDSFRRALSGISGDELRVYVARANGRPVACLMTVDDDSNTDISWVAVEPEARGRGLSGKLLAHALSDGAERGQRTSTLVSTKLGRPVYERLGFRGLGRLQMWERRTG